MLYIVYDQAALNGQEGHLGQQQTIQPDLHLPQQGHHENENCLFFFNYYPKKILCRISKRLIFWLYSKINQGNFIKDKSTKQRYLKTCFFLSSCFLLLTFYTRIDPTILSAKTHT